MFENIKRVSHPSVMQSSKIVVAHVEVVESHHGHEFEPIDLLNSNLLGGGGSRLRNGNRQNAVLEAGLDSVLVDALAKGEGTLELADNALASPVGGLVRLAGLVGFGHSIRFLALLSFGLGLGLVRALRATLHDKGLRVGELNFDILLGNAGQLTV